jgi:hypothetical protein
MVSRSEGSTQIKSILIASRFKLLLSPLFLANVQPEFTLFPVIILGKALKGLN